MSELLTFELSNDIQEIEIHGNEKGLRKLIEIIERTIELKTHDHLMTPSWSGSELTEEAQGDNTRLINKVTIHIWD
jgi:hypothetical protein